MPTLARKWYIRSDTMIRYIIECISVNRTLWTNLLSWLTVLRYIYFSLCHTAPEHMCVATRMCDRQRVYMWIRTADSDAWCEWHEHTIQSNNMDTQWKHCSNHTCDNEYSTKNRPIWWRQMCVIFAVPSRIPFLGISKITKTLHSLLRRFESIPFHRITKYILLI